MTEADVYAELTQLFRQVFRNPAIELEAASTAATIGGWDSFKFVDLVMTIERSYGIRIDALSLDELESVGDLVRLVLRLTAARAG